MKLTDKDPMPFGLHKGKPMVEVPAATLLYYYENFKDLGGPVKEYIKDNLEVLKAQVSREKRFNSR